jgi:hypothetical protein
MCEDSKCSISASIGPAPIDPGNCNGDGERTTSSMKSQCAGDKGGDCGRSGEVVRFDCDGCSGDMCEDSKFCLSASMGPVPVNTGNCSGDGGRNSSSRGGDCGRSGEVARTDCDSCGAPCVRGGRCGDGGGGSNSIKTRCNGHGGGGCGRSGFGCDDGRADMDEDSKSSPSRSVGEPSGEATRSGWGNCGEGSDHSRAPTQTTDTSTVKSNTAGTLTH